MTELKAGQAPRTPSPGAAAAEFLLGLVAAPLSVTAISRLTPNGWPLWLPDLVIAAAGLAAVLASPRYRAAAAGLLVGLVMFAAFLLWIFGQFDGLGAV